MTELKDTKNNATIMFLHIFTHFGLFFEQAPNIFKFILSVNHVIVGQLLDSPEFYLENSIIF